MTGAIYEQGGEEVFCQTDSPTDCPKNYTCKLYGNPSHGYLSFDNIGISSLIIFSMFTMDNWIDMMYLIRRAKKTYLYDMFFVTVVYLGAFFIINLIAAI